MFKNKKIENMRRVTNRFGYTLFGLIAIATIISTIIPLTSTLFHPTARYFNIVVVLFTFTAAAVLPALASYFLGDRSTHSKNKALHHYNGILFGIAAYWVMLLLNFVSFGAFSSELLFPYSILVANGVPVGLTIVTMIFLAISYAKKQKRGVSVLQHRPYQIVLVGAFIASLVVNLLPQYFDASTYLIIALLYIAIPLSMVVVSYIVLSRLRLNRWECLTASVIAVSMAYISVTSIGQLMSYITYIMITPILISFIIWVLYLWQVVRKR